DLVLLGETPVAGRSHVRVSALGSEPDHLVAVSFLLGAGALGLLLWFIRHRWRGPLAGFLFFVGTLFPAMGFANVYFFRYSFGADHFQYLASLGVIVVASSGIALLLEAVPRRASWAGPALCIALVGTLAALTWQQSRMYGDPLTLYRATLDRNPSCWMCHNNLGILLRAAGRRWEAIPHYEAALRLKPDDPVAHNNLGNVLAQEQAFPLAMAHFEEALRLQPGYAEAHNNLGNTLLREGRGGEPLRGRAETQAWFRRCAQWSRACAVPNGKNI